MSTQPESKAEPVVSGSGTPLSLGGDSLLTTPPTQRARVVGGNGEFAVRVLIVLGLSILLGTLLLLGWVARDILMLTFAGILLAVVISWPADLLVQYAKWKRGPSLALVLLGIVIVVGGGGYLMGNAIADQVTELRQTLPAALTRLNEQLQQKPSGKFLLEQTADIRTAASEYATRPETLGRVGGVITATFGVVANVGLVAAMALLLAVSPGFYVNGLVALVPMGTRPRFREVLAKTGHTLQWWFFGQLCSMAAIGLLTFVGLSVLGVPLALTLGALAGLLNFIPNFGPLLAALPAVVIALAPHGNQVDLNYNTALYVGILYILVQVAEGNIITPFIQHRAVALPPALIVVFQVLLALLVGPIGLILATPGLAVLLVWVKMLYVQDTLGDRETPATVAPQMAQPQPPQTTA